MTYPTDSYAHLIVQGVGGEAEHVKTGTGILTSWNPSTFESTVRHRGTDFHDLPVLSRVEALGFHTGQVVLLEKRRQAKRGLYQYAIKSAPLAPGPGAAAGAAATIEAIVEQIAPAVFAARDIFGSEPGSQSTTSSTYVSLSGGPSVEVPVSESGIMVVGVQANISIVNSDADNRVGFMAYDISGATSRSASDADAYVVGAIHSDQTPVSGINVRSMAFSVHEGLNPGMHTVSARYRAEISGAQPIVFGQRRVRALGY